MYQRNTNIKGPMHAFGYSYIEAHLPASEFKALVLKGDTAYEALNLVDGQRTVSDIRDWMVAEFAALSGAVNLEDVMAYLQALERIGVLSLER